MRNFNKFKRYDYAVEVSKELQHMLRRFTEPQEQFGIGFEIVEAYIGYSELLLQQAKSVSREFPQRLKMPICRIGDLRGSAEFGLCIMALQFIISKLQFAKVIMKSATRASALKLGQALLMRSKDNEFESFKIFQKDLDSIRATSEKRCTS